MHLKHRLITLIIALFVTGLLYAQIPYDSVLNNPKVAAANLRPYFYSGETNDAHDLKGYKPFYISHFGRHGSRYLSSPKYTKAAFDYFTIAKNEGLLTERGDSLYNAMNLINKAHDGMYGELAPLGAKEHRGIAKRMYEREKKVFKSRSRTKVRCVSSIYSRCILSMANFTEELSSHAPSLEMTYLVGKRYNQEYLNVQPDPVFKPEANRIIDSLKCVALNPEKLLSIYLTDTEKVKQFSLNVYEVEMGIYFYWGVSFDLDYLGLDLTNLIPLDEMAACGTIESTYRFATVGVPEDFRKYTFATGEKLLKDIVRKADEATKADSDLAADLRFAHDSGMLPLCSLLGIEGYPTYSVNEAYKNWNMAEVVPMCANIQIVFYRGKDDILVKILVNEEVAHIPNMTPIFNNYYRWNDIRNHIMNL